MKVLLDIVDFNELPITVDSGILGGKPVFSGTRVSLDALWTNLAEGASLDDFLDWFPTVSREQAEEVLKFAYRSLARLGFR
jgi:uncharacterized protein (DUF433 family)